jgi:hypothetical protein
MSRFANHTPSPAAFIQMVRQEQCSGRRYAVLVLATAHAMYHVPQNWAHAIVFLGMPDYRIRIYDPLGQVDPTEKLQLSNCTIEAYTGKLGAVCALVRGES